jgi:hypothetical protein
VLRARRRAGRSGQDSCRATSSRPTSAARRS